MFETLANHVVDWLLIAPISLCFVGSFIGGTAVTLVFASFAGSTDLAFWPILTGAALGNFASDIGWFALARSPMSDRLRNSRQVRQRAMQITQLRGNYGKRDVLFFIAIKFAYGLRIAQILVLGAAHYPWGRFLMFDGVAVLVINGAAVVVGWTFGRGVTLYLDLFESVGMIVTTTAFLLLAFFVLRRLISRRMLGKR